MSYLIAGKTYPEEMLNSISYNPDAKQTEITFYEPSYREVKWKKWLSSPVYRWSELRETTYVLSGKRDVPTGLSPKGERVELMKDPKELVSIVHKYNNLHETSLATYLFVVPYLCHSSTPEKVVIYEYETS